MKGFRNMAKQKVNRRSFIGIGAAFTAVGCVDVARGRTAKFSMNASTLRGYNLSLFEQVKAVSASGFTGYEPWMKDIRAAKESGTFGDVCRMARDCGLSFVNGIAFGQWVSPVPSVQAAGLEETKRDMALLAEMGCPCIAASMFGVQKPGAPCLTSEEIAERYVVVLELGKAMGVKPLLEYWGHSVNLSRLEDALDVLALVNRPDAAVLADVYHTYRGGGSFGAYRRLTPAMLPVLHVNDYPAEPSRDKLVDADRVWPGDGLAPWREISGNLAASGADPWLSIELFNPAYWRTTPADTLRVGLEKIRRLFGGCREAT